MCLYFQTKPKKNIDFDIEKEYLFGEELVNDPQLVFIELDSPIHAPADRLNTICSL